VNTSTSQAGSSAAAAESVRANLRSFLGEHLHAPVETDVDLFASGLMSSLFALELVVHVESAFGVTVAGDDLMLDNFRTVDAMTALVLRLRGGA
jgi:methoxymalonate biosynthesis acyl carrier protein